MPRYSNIRFSPWSDGAGLPSREALVLLCEKLNHSLGVIREPDISALEQRVAPNDLNSFKMALANLAPWRTLKGFGSLAHVLSPTLSNDIPLCIPLAGSTADVLAYLVHQKNMLGGTLPLPLHKGMKRRHGAVLLDSWTLRELESNSSLARLMLEQGMRLLHVPGMNDGLRQVCGRDLQSLADLAHTQIREGKIHSLVDETAAIKSTLQRLSLVHRLGRDLSRQLVVCSVPQPTSAPSSSELAELLTPHPGIEIATLEAWARTVPATLGSAMLELFSSNTKILSMEALFRAAMQLHSKVEALRRELGFEDKPLWCFAPDDCNSMQLALFLMRLTGTNISVLRPGSLTKVSRGSPANERKLVAVFDDVALTGDTLRRHVSFLSRQLPGAFQVILAGVFASTAKAREDFENLIGSDPNKRYAFVEHIPVLAESEFSRRDDEVSRKVQPVLTQYAGYGELGTMVVLPFGAPNNNHLFFNQTFAGLLTYGGRGVRAVAGLGRLSGAERAAIQTELLKRLAP